MVVLEVEFKGILIFFPLNPVAPARLLDRVLAIWVEGLGLCHPGPGAAPGSVLGWIMSDLSSTTPSFSSLFSESGPG